MKSTSKNNDLKTDNIFLCPKCHKNINENKDYLICELGHKFFIKDKIYLFNKKLDNFYEGKFINLNQDFNFKNPIMLCIYKTWSKISLSRRHDRAFQNIISEFPKGKFVLDFGCGDGNISYNKMGKVVGIDISHQSLENAKKIYHKVVMYNGSILPFKKNTFDYVFSNQVFGHIPCNKKNIIIQEIKRVLKTNGIIYLSIETDSKENSLVDFIKEYPKLYKKQWIEMYGHFGLELPSQCIKRFQKNGFKILKVEKGLRYLWQAKGYFNIFKKNYAKKNQYIKMLTIISKPFAENIYLGAIWDFVLGIFSRLFEWHLPLDSCTGIMLICKSDKMNTSKN